MENKYTLSEGYESLERIKLMMGYELNKTLNENKKNILNEDISNFPWCVRFGSVAWPTDPKNSKSKEYTSAIANGSGGFDSTNATYQTFNTPFILNKETHRFFSDGTYLKKSQDGKKWIQGTYKCSNPSSTKGPGNTGSILFDNERDIKGDMDKSLTKKALGIISNPDRNRLDYLEKLKRQAGMENMLSRKEWMKPEIQQEYQELKQKLEGLFPPSGNLDGTEKPKPPQIVGQYIKSPGANTRVRWEYIRYENKEPVVYSFEDLERGGEEYRKHYEQYKKDLKKWDFDNSVHDFFTILQVGSLLIPVVGPAISAGLGVGEAALFYQEGDEFMAGLMLIFSIIPGAGKLIPEFMSLNKASKTRISKFIRGGSKTTKITPKEKEVVEKLVQQQSKLALFGKLAKLFIKIRTMIDKMNPFTFIRFISFMMKKYPALKSILGEGMMFGGVFLGWSQIYKKIEETKNKEEQKKLEAQIKQKQTQIAQKLENPTDQQALALQGVDAEKLEKDMCAAFPDYC